MTNTGPFINTMTNTGPAQGDWDHKVWRRPGAYHHRQRGRLRLHQADQGGEHYQQHPVHWGSSIIYLFENWKYFSLSQGGRPHREDWWGEPGGMQTLWGGDNFFWHHGWFFKMKNMVKYESLKVDEVFEKLADVKELRNVETMTLHWFLNN